METAETAVFGYADYRHFLRDRYRAAKQADPKYSHRYFAMKAGVRSGGFFSDVLSGKRNLTTRQVLGLVKALRLRGAEAEYFQDLVGYCQAKDIEERTHYYQHMLRNSKGSARKLEKDQFEFYSRWYYSAIRELLCFYRFSGDYDALAAMLNPSITGDEARTAIELLERLELIERDDQGCYRQHTPVITSGSDFRSLLVARFQRETMSLASTAMDRFPVSMRDSSTLTMTLSEKSFQQAKNEIAALRKRLLALAESDNEVDRVYHFGFQLFPMSRF